MKHVHSDICTALSDILSFLDSQYIVGGCGSHTGGALPVLGFQMSSYTVLEGFSISVCVELISGVAVDDLLLQMVSFLAGTASGVV